MDPFEKGYPSSMIPDGYYQNWQEREKIRSSFFSLLFFTRPENLFLLQIIEFLL